MGHPPAFPVCLTVNLAAGMRKGGGGGGWRRRDVYRGVRQTETAEEKSLAMK